VKTLDDEVIASAMRSIGGRAAPPVDAVQRVVATAHRRRSTRRAISTAAAVASVVCIIGVFAAVAHTDDAPGTAPATPRDVNWQELTGKEVGEALGWTAQPTGSAYCPDVFVEFADGPEPNDAMGFCFTYADLEAAGVPGTWLEARVLANQIRGYERSPELFEYVQLQDEYMDLVGSHEPDWDRIDEIRDRLRVLRLEIGMVDGPGNRPR